MSDYMVRATAAEEHIRAFAATTREMAEEGRRVHGLSPVAAAALGRALTAGGMMGAMMKGEKDVLTITFDGDGPIGGITVTARSDGDVKGYVKNPDVMLPPSPQGKLDVGGAVGHGTLRVIRDIGLKDPYIGEVEIQTGEIADDLTYYFASSEQTPSVVGLGVLMNHDNTVREAGGFIIQLMPDAPAECIDRLEAKMKGIKSVTDLLKNGGTPESILQEILGDQQPVIHEKMPVRFHCDCSRERVTKALIAIGKKELDSMIADGKEVTLSCGFCEKKYSFSIDELKEIEKSASLKQKQ